MRIVRTLLIAGWIVAATGAVGAQASASVAPNFNVVKVADGVYAGIRKEPPSLWFNPNNIFIIGKRDVIVVDANISSAYTREVIAALRKLTDKPVKYVINTHWHEDHIIGNRAYREAYPGVKFIAQRSTLTDLPTIGATNRKGSVANGEGFIQFLRGQITKGENLDGAKITDEERAGYASDAALVESYMAESKDFQIIMPDILVDDRMALDQDGRQVEILFLGRAHTGADLVVRLPKENIVLCGDLVVYPVPLIGSTSYPLEYGTTLEKLLALKPKVLIPGHGPIMRDTNYLQQMIRLLGSIKHQVLGAVARGESLEQTRKSVNLDEFQQLFAGTSQHLRFVFTNYVTLPAVAAAFQQATTKPEDGPAAVVQQLFDAMREKSADKIRTLFLPEGRLVAIDKPKTEMGPSKTRVFTAEQFAQTIAAGQGEYIERMTMTTVDVQGDLALVSGRYTFHIGDKFSHCGTNAFQLVRTEAGWKIANGASTLEFQCVGEAPK